MSQDDPTSTSGDETPGPIEGAEKLEHIIDDTEEIGDTKAWILGEFHQGRDADSIFEEMISTGWPSDEAEVLVEEGRRATRHLRGGLTREAVAKSAEQRYRKAFKIAFRVTLAAVILVAIAYSCESLTFHKPDKSASQPTQISQ